MKESWELTQGEMGKIFLFQAVAGLASFVPILVMGLGFAALRAAMGEPQGGAVELVQSSVIFFFLWNIYGAMHAPELVYFYGMRATRAVPIVAQGKVLGI